MGKPLKIDHERTSRILTGLMLSLALAFGLALAAESLFHTYVLDPAHYASSHLYEIDENELTNLALSLAGIFALWLFNRKVRVSDRALTVSAVVLLSAYGAIGVAWVLGARAVPSSDPGMIIQSANLIIRGELAPFQTPGDHIYFYFLRFPFQFGFLSYVELLLRLVGEDALLKIAPVLNVFYLLAGYAAILKTTKAVFSDNNITFSTLLLLFFGIQPLLGCTLVYGTIPAFMLSMWAIFFIGRYMRQNRKRDVAFGAILLALAVYFKPNASIVAVAAAILLLLYALRNKRSVSALAALIVLLSILPLPRLVQGVYEKRVGAHYGAGMSKMAWMAMCSQKSSMAAGWYSMYSWRLYEEAGGDMEKVNERSREDVVENYRGFIEDPAYARVFFHEKFCSQWNENTFQSVWTSRVCETAGEIAPFVKAAYDGVLKGPMEWYMNQYVQLLYCAYALGLLGLLLRKRTEDMLFYPLILVGAMLFHLLFEAKAQYVLTYLPQFAPVAALSFSFTGKRK